ncbi:MAG TPA: RDD family protein [Bryobacteraceae bacterium]|nr:RDD family protein [Bryobacteraceae bacterium]
MTSRAIAAVMDAIFLATICAVTGMAAMVKTGGLPFTAARVWLSMCAIAALATIYFWLGEGLFGATLGKAAAGIQVRRATGGRCGLGPALVRNLGRIIDALGGYLFGFIVAYSSKLRQRLGDHLAGTIVVERKLSRAARTALVISWIEVLSAGLAGSYWLHHITAASSDPLPAADPIQVSMRSLPPPVNPFQVLNFQFLENENGSERAATPYRPGNTVCLQYDISGYATGADRRADLVITGQALDLNGRSLDRPSVTQFNGRPDPGSPLRGTFHLKLPPYLAAGPYRIVIQVHDQLNNADLEMAPSFAVEAVPVQLAAANFELRDLEMSLSRDGPAQEAPVLTAAGTVYMRARLFGMQFQGDRVSGRIALRVIGPDGRVVFNEPNYIDIKATLTYHPPAFWLPVHGFLKVPANLAKGTYVEQYTVVDDFARREIRRDTAFQVD